MDQFIFHLDPNNIFYEYLEHYSKVNYSGAYLLYYIYRNKIYSTSYYIIIATNYTIFFLLPNDDNDPV